MPATGFAIRPTVKMLILAIATLLLAVRIWFVFLALAENDAQPLLVYPFGAILPYVLIVGLAFLPPTRTREGLLMRLGATIQLLLIIALPSQALLLALGLPVVFLAVEIFETRIPRQVRDPLARMVIA